MIRRILDPNPVTRITMDEIKADEWFRKDYNPPNTDDDDENVHANGMAFSVHEMVWILNMYRYIFSYLPYCDCEAEPFFWCSVIE